MKHTSIHKNYINKKYMLTKILYMFDDKEQNCNKKSLIPLLLLVTTFLPFPVAVLW